MPAAYELLTQVNARLLGLVFNGVTGRDAEYRSDYGYYQRRRTEDAPSSVGP
ncbi:MAG: hypothetical protein R2932_56840 [Caldilineaceae bacterium]